MTTLQEAAMRKALEALETCSYGDYSAKHVVDPSFDGDAVEAAIESLKAALEQQGAPAAYITDTEQGPMVWTPEMYDEACTYCDDGEFPVPLYTVTPRPTSGDYALGYAEGFNDACKPAPQAQPDWLLKTTQDLANSIRRRCYPEVPQFEVLDDLAGVISQIDNMTTGMERKAAPQPAQDVPEVGFGNMPYSPYLFGGLRFKMNFDKKSGNATNFHGVESALQGAWVALVDATDNRHLQSAQPVAPPLTLEQILDIVKKLDETPDMSHVDVLKTFARAIEAAHGIGRKPCS